MFKIVYLEAAKHRMTWYQFIMLNYTTLKNHDTTFHIVHGHVKPDQTVMIKSGISNRIN